MSEKTERYFVGLNCGLSADGIDAVVILLESGWDKISYEMLAFESMFIPDSLRREILAVAGGKQMHAGHFANLQRQLASAAVAMCKKVLSSAGLDASSVFAAGWSGYPLGGKDGRVIELDGADLISQNFPFPVINGFFSSISAAGGRPCGLSAWLDYKRLGDERISRVLVHLGALAEITFIPAESEECEVIAAIAGPGTILIDDLANRSQNRVYDTDGSMAAGGKVNPVLLSELKSDKFFREELPRYQSMEEYGPVYLLRLLEMAKKYDCTWTDLIATVSELSAWCISEAVKGLTQRPHEVILCGGGAKNIHLAGRIRQLLSPSSTYTSERYNLGLTAKKAIDMAILAAACVDGVVAIIPQACGLSKPVLPGSITGGSFEG